LIQAQLAVDRQAHFLGVLVFLTVILPPANWAQLEGARRFKGLISTTRAAITDFDCSTHIGIDGRMDATDYELRQAICSIHGFLRS
jgi:hypothetical protein